ncbi:hypothetical protein BVY04_02435 [bacterium M21]|nr:hypothetical protein BVY04_02435 [bacterium M21]
MFGLSGRLLYKKGKVADKRLGQLELATLIRCLERSPVLPLTISVGCEKWFDAERILRLRGADSRPMKTFWMRSSVCT